MKALLIPVASALFAAGGYFLSKLFLEPMLEQKKHIKDIVAYFYLTLPDIANPIPKDQSTQESINRRVEISNKWQDLTSKLIAKTHDIYAYNFLYRIKLIRYSKAEIEDLSTNLRRVSNTMFKDCYNMATIKNIKKVLKLKQ